VLPAATVGVAVQSFFSGGRQSDWPKLTPKPEQPKQTQTQNTNTNNNNNNNKTKGKQSKTQHVL
jgi:hypothetical protein